MLSWTCPAPWEWDRYLINRSAVDEKALSRHLEQCSDCRLALERRKLELGAVATAWEKSGQPRVIYLNAWVASPAIITGDLLLAAQGTKESTLPKSITLLSPDQRLLLRAVRDHHTGETWLYLLSDEPAICQGVLIKPFGWDNEYLTDSEGRVNLGVIEWPGPSMLTAEVHSPVATFTLSPSRDFTADRSAVVLESSDGDRIRVTISEHGRNKRVEIEVLKLEKIIAGVPLRVAVREGRGSDILLVSSESAERVAVGEVRALEPIEIFLFQ